MLQFDEIKKRKRLELSKNLDKYEKMDNFPEIIASLINFFTSQVLKSQKFFTQPIDEKTEKITFPKWVLSLLYYY